LLSGLRAPSEAPHPWVSTSGDWRIRKTAAATTGYLDIRAAYAVLQEASLPARQLGGRSGVASRQAPAARRSQARALRWAPWP